MHNDGWRGSVRVILVWVGLVTGWAGPALAGDWPMYKHDADRSGVTDEPLTLPLRIAWC